MPTERDDCTYSDFEFDHTAEEVADNPPLPAGHGSNVYSDAEWESIREVIGDAGPTNCFGCGSEDGRTRLGALLCHDCRDNGGPLCR